MFCVDRTGERDIRDPAEVRAHVDTAENRDRRGSKAPLAGPVFMDRQALKEKTATLVQLV